MINEILITSYNVLWLIVLIIIPLLIIYMKKNDK